MSKRVSLKKQLVTTLFLVGLIPFIIMGVISYNLASDSLKYEAFNKLELSKESKKHELNTYITLIDGAIKNLGRSQDVTNMFMELVELHKQKNVKGTDNFFITNDVETKDVYSRYEKYFSEFIQNYKLYDLFVICKPHGHVMYTVTKEGDLGENLKHGKLNHSGLAKAWAGAVRENRTFFTDMEPYAPSNDEPAMFMATPIIDTNTNETLGVVAVQLSLETINNIMQNRVGMGESGESYLVGSDKLMRSDSYLDKENHSVLASFKNPSLGSIDTEAVTEAFNGISTTKEIIDYNGNSVISSYSLVNFFGVKWAIIAEIDKSEIFAPVSNLRNITIIIGLIFMVIIVLVAFFMSRVISKPIITSVEIITEANNQVVSASNQISQSATSLAEGATQQASSVEEVSATIEQSTAINSQNAQNSKEGDNLAKESYESALVGNEKIDNLMHKMEEISKASQKISLIIKTIDEIAFQTNLLALNAAVEAARAGEHGLGFAVVAEEVKSLANRSATAAKETTDIIETTIEQIKEGNQIANDTKDSFNDILLKIKNTSNLIGEISISANEQSDGMNQISKAMSQIDQVTQQNAATSEEAAAASEQLNAQAISMMNSVIDVAKIVGAKTASDDDFLQLEDRS